MLCYQKTLSENICPTGRKGKESQQQGTGLRPMAQIRNKGYPIYRHQAAFDLSSEL